MCQLQITPLYVNKQLHGQTIFRNFLSLKLLKLFLLLYNENIFTVV